MTFTSPDRLMTMVGTPGEEQGALIAARRRMAKKLMIVDDALIMRMKIGQIARSAGWEVVAEAADGQEAVELYQKSMPDLTTLDVVMPRQDGPATLKEILKIDADAKIVMVSAVNQRSKLEECITAGAIDFIVKPFDASRLKAFFEKQLQAAS